MKKYIKKKYIIPLVITVLVILSCIMFVPVNYSLK